MTSITPKLTAAITTIALLAPVAGAQAAGLQTLHPVRHFAISGSERHLSTHHAQRPAAKFHRDSRSI